MDENNDSVSKSWIVFRHGIVAILTPAAEFFAAEDLAPDYVVGSGTRGCVCSQPVDIRCNPEGVTRVYGINLICQWCFYLLSILSSFIHWPFFYSTDLQTMDGVQQGWNLDTKNCLFSVHALDTAWTSSAEWLNFDCNSLDWNHMCAWTYHWWIF